MIVSVFRHSPALILLLLSAAAPAEGADPAAGSPPTSMHHYRLLEQALPRYQELARHPGLTRLPALPRRSVRAGEKYDGSPALRQLLAAIGDLPPGSAAGDPPDIVDAALVAALQRFQERHGLTQDGILGPATWRALTTPMQARVRQIERTLARWRSLPPNPHSRAIFVNIPRFRLYAASGKDDRESSLLQMDVVVGRIVEKLQTPVFSADLTHLIFRPYWDVPRSILVGEILPAARKDPGYLARRNYEAVDSSGKVVSPAEHQLPALASGSLRLRQRPGPENALGAVKFMLPNPHSVYLHDTPEQLLFSRTTRAFSHGCIRVASPAVLARWLLGADATWTPERIAEAMNGREPLQVDLPEPVRVYIVYGTAIAREDGSVLFLDDLYRLDKD